MHESPKYPHLKNVTRFPETGEPYTQYANRFDYREWKAGTLVRLYNVPWNDRNIVDFENDDKRDNWFSAHAISEYRFNTVMHLMPDGSIKLPIPFESVAQCNYLTVTFDIEPVALTGKPRVSVWCYWLHDIEQCAPSTTRAILELDAWQTFGHHVRIGSMQLTQGHAPMLDTTVNEYLANPVAHNSCMLAPDVSYGDPAAIVTHSEFHPFGAGDKSILFATTLTRGQLTQIGGNPASAYDNGSTPPAYRDNPARWGHQYEVDGYEWHFGEADYSALNVPVESYGADTLPTGLHVFGMASHDAMNFFKSIAAKTPQVMQTIQAMWQIGNDMIDTGDTFDVLGIKLFEPKATHELDAELTLTTDMFGYDTRYSQIPKLYTYPYAALTLSDNDGTTCTVRIENCGTLTLHQRVSTVYPYLKAQAFLTGVNGTGGSTYEWRDINGNKEKRTAYDTPFTDFMATYDIPLYALWLDGQTDWALHNQRASVETERYKALNAYHIGMRNTNTGYENTKDSANTGYQNTVRSADTGQTNTNDTGDTTQANGNRSVETARGNATRSNTTAKQNTDAAAATALANGNASAATAQTNGNAAAYAAEQNAFSSNATGQTNAHATADMTRANMDNTIKTSTNNLNKRNANRTANQTNNTGSAVDLTVASNTLSNQNLAADIAFMNTSFAVETATGAVSTAASAISSIATGNVGGAVAGVVNGALSIAKDAAINSATIANNTAKNNNSTTFSTQSTQIQNTNGTEICNNNNTYDSDVTGNNNDLADQNTTNSVNTAKNNAARTRTTGDGNAARTYNTSVSNNGRTYSTAVSNNQRAYDTTTGNAQRSFNAAEANAEASRQTGLTNNEQSNQLTHRNSQRSRDTSVTNAEKSRDTALNNALESRESAEFSNKTTLEQTQRVAELSYEQHSTDAPVRFGDNTGDAVPDVFGYRGVQVRVLTQPKGAIRMAGDHMLRYGYAFNGVWTPARLQVMKHFTYWKCDEIWITGASDIMESARDAIRAMFVAGVTVWSDPNEIGAVDVADNM